MLKPNRRESFLFDNVNGVSYELTTVRLELKISLALIETET